MKTKTKLLTLLLLTIIIAISFYIYRSIGIEEKTIDLSKSFSDEFVKIFELNSEHNFEKNLFTSEGKGDLENIISNLVEKDNLEIVIATEEELKEFSKENIAASPSVGDSEYNNNDNENETDISIIPKGSTVFKDEHEYKVKVSDLKMHTPEYALVEFIGGSFKVYKSEIPETYSMILKNPRYSYVLKKIELVSNEGLFQKKIKTKVFVQSMYDNHLKVIELNFIGDGKETMKINEINFNF